MNENETITTGGVNGEVKPVTGKVDVDGSEMMVSDIPVNLPDKVVVIDQKIGKEIGFVLKEDVLRLVTKDARYEGFDDEATGQFMLTYNSDWDKAIEFEVDDVISWLRLIEAQLETALGADDPKKLRLGVSYVKGKHTHVCYLHLSLFKNCSKYLNSSIVAALQGGMMEKGEFEIGEGPTQRLIAYFRGANTEETKTGEI